MIRNEVSQIVGKRIHPGKWDEVFESVEKTGGIDVKTLIAMSLELCKTVEVMEESILSMESEVNSIFEDVELLGKEVDEMKKKPTKDAKKETPKGTK